MKHKTLDRKTFTIGVLCLTAVLLFLGTLIPLPTARGEFAIKDRDYQLVTVTVQGGGDALYVIDHRTGMMVVFTYDTRQRALVPRSFQSVDTALGE
jgi:hypothetical protein